MAAERRRAKERLIDYAKPRSDRADRVLLSQLSEVTEAPQCRSAVRGFTTSAKSKILSRRQNETIRGPHQQTAHDARIWIQFEVRQRLPGPFASLDPHLVVNQCDQGVHSTLSPFRPSRFFTQPANQLFLREPPDTLDRIVRR